MPPLHRVLADHDLGLLRLIAELWGVELTAGSQREAADELAGRMLAPELAQEIIAALPREARAGFEQLAREGRQLLASFTRRYGELRAMGPARRDRERPWANAPSASEVLWYRGLIGRAFFDAGRGPEEFVFIPDDLRSLAYVATAGAAEAAARQAPPGRPAPQPPADGVNANADTPSGTNQSRTNPSGTNPSGLNASGINASGTDASGINASGINASGINASGTDASGINASGINASGINASGIDASGINASGDDAVTLLAYLQVVAVRLEAPVGALAGAAASGAGASVPGPHRAGLGRFLRQPPALDFTLHLLRQLGLVEDPGGKEPVRLAPERVQPFLQAGAPERARRLAEAWRDARDWNDLLGVPGLVFEGQSWRNDPQAARQAILKLLAQVPPGVWWSLDSFVEAIKERQPDFQRPAGDYDSWYIRDSRSGAFLRGFENWDRVDGALVRWVIEQPLAWLGAVQNLPVVENPSAGQYAMAADKTTVASKTAGASNTPAASKTAGASNTPAAGQAAGPAGAAQRSRAPAFRITPYGAALLGLAGWPEAPEPAPLEVEAGGLVRAPAGESGAPASGYDRFQLARIGDWLTPDAAAPDGGAGGALVYPYRLTPASLARAVRKGITPGRIVTFLERAAAGQRALPALAAALRRWEKNGAEASLRETVVLRLASPELLATLRQTPGLEALLGEAIGPAAVEVRRADVDQLRAALWDAAILMDGSG